MWVALQPPGQLSLEVLHRRDRDRSLLPVLVVCQGVEQFLLSVQLLQLVVEVEEFCQVESVCRRGQLLQQSIGQKGGIGEVDTSLKFQKKSKFGRNWNFSQTCT